MKRLFCYIIVGFCIIYSLQARVYAQEKLNSNLSTVDSTAKDTLTQKSKPLIEDPVKSTAVDSILYSLDNKKVFLYGDAKVNYQNLELSASRIEFNMETKEAFAYGLPDSTGKIVGKPVFKEGSESFNMDSIRYNFDSKKAKIYGVISKQGEGFLHSEMTKKMPDNTVNVIGGKYTTCDAEHPHFYIALTKAKIIPNKQIITGPAYLVIEDVPMPIGIPFGFFPNRKGRHSGILIPRYGEENNRGFFLQQGGYYFGMSEFFDLALTGSIYSFGGWDLNARSAYKIRYKYSGSFDLSGVKLVVGSKGDSDYMSTGTYSIRWTHTQDAKFKPNSSFNASVNFTTSKYNTYASYNPSAYLNNTISSSIAYQRVFVGTPFSLTVNASHSQNTRDESVTISFPTVTFNMASIYPFRSKNFAGKPNVFQKIGVSYSTNLQNQYTTKEEMLFKGNWEQNMKNGMVHRVPVSTSFSLLKYLTITPSLSMADYWYTETIRKSYNETSKLIEVDTVPGFKRGMEYSYSAGMSTKIYGTFMFASKSKVQAIRHLMTPSVSFSYKPDFSTPGWGYYGQVQDSTGKIQTYSIFQNGILGGPSANRSGAIGFSLDNILEMKIKSDKDSTQKTRKIKIFDNLRFSSSYNLLADSMKLAPINFSGRISLTKEFALNFGGLINPYALTEKGAVIDQWQYRKNRSLGRLTNFTTSFSLAFQSKTGKGSGQNQGQVGVPPVIESFQQQYGENNNQYGQLQSAYTDFDVPWNISLNYNLNYSKPQFQSTINQTVNFSGGLSLTPKWKLSFSSGWDFKTNQLTYTNMGINRDLHCWEMSFNWIPMGPRQSYSFRINVKSGMLRDLKYDKRKTWSDNIDQRF
ncbi:putative LPS assembly protein LptD [Williamwhitmania taraxaci]|uniref:putative LPS assembly protein LptD n=1 Tax=Williamwhitmania taraxaci TaxID=1640674 RepID=UPI000F76C1DF|nr:putative LPS assembly protein LptD [Williamwhitmania taraxaci]